MTKLSRFSRLSNDDCCALAALSEQSEPVDRHQQLWRDDDHPDAAFLLLEGLACRYKILPDGKRRILAFLLPGDLCHVGMFIYGRVDHNIAMLSAGSVAYVAEESLSHIVQSHPAIRRALQRSNLVDEAVLRQWLLNVGGRSADARVAHLLCELYVRMEGLGRARAGAFKMQMTQSDVADAVGLTSVHVNRVLKRLRDYRLVTVQGHNVTIHDVERTMDVAGFDRRYLFEDNETPTPAANWPNKSSGEPDAADCTVSLQKDDDFFRAPGIDLGERKQPAVQEREAI